MEAGKKNNCNIMSGEKGKRPSHLFMAFLQLET